MWKNNLKQNQWERLDRAQQMQHKHKVLNFVHDAKKFTTQQIKC
jgi:hypothetical protein